MNGKGYPVSPPTKYQSPALPSSGPSGQDGLSGVGMKLEMRDYYAIETEFIKYVDLDILVPKLITQRLLTEGEAYSVKNPYIVPHQRVFHLFQYISNKGPYAPAKVLQCLQEPPLHHGHAYLASRLLKEPQTENSYTKVVHRPNPEVRKRLTKLKSKFAGLLIDTHRYLREMSVSIEELKIFVSFLTASEESRSTLYFNHHIPRISSASSIDEIFALLSENHYWTHLNYHILEAVVDRFGNDHLRKLVDTYTQEVDEFQSTTKLSDYCSSLEVTDTRPIKPDFAPVKAHFDLDWNEYGMSQMKGVHSQMCQHFKLPSHSLMFQTAEPGSVCITWQVPCSVVASMVLRSKEIRHYLRELGMDQLQIGEHTVLYKQFDEDAEEMEDPQQLYQNRKSDRVMLTAQQCLELFKTLDSMEERLSDIASSFDEHKSAVVGMLGGRKSGTLTSSVDRRSSSTTSTTTITSSPLKLSRLMSSMSTEDDFEPVPDMNTDRPQTVRKESVDYGCEPDEWTGGDSGYGDPHRWRTVGLLHSEEPPDETIDEDNEQYVDVNDYVSKESPRQQSPRQQSKPQRPSQEKCWQKNRPRHLKEEAQADGPPGQTKFKRKPGIRERPPAIPPRPH